MSNQWTIHFEGNLGKVTLSSDGSEFAQAWKGFGKQFNILTSVEEAFCIGVGQELVNVLSTLLDCELPEICVVELALAMHNRLLQTNNDMNKA